jgi:MFS family permease
MASPFVPELGFTFILLLVSMSWGLIMGYWSSAQKSFEHDFSISGHLSTLFNLLAPGACILGGPLVNLIIGRTGRRLASVAIAAVAFVAWIALGLLRLAADYRSVFWLACALRALLGVSVGATSTVTPMYITELAPAALRGAFGPLHQFGISVGASLCYALGAVPVGGGSMPWWEVALFSSAPAGLHLLLVWLVPESPAVARVQAVERADSLLQRRYAKPIAISLLLMFFQQFGGTSAFLANLQQIFMDSGSALKPEIATLLVGIAGAVAALVSSSLIGCFGRKVAWLVSSAAQAVALTVAALQERYKFSPVVPIICLFLDNFTFGIGTAPIPWFFVPELFPDSVRSLAGALITGAAWIMGTVLFFMWDAMKASAMGQAGGFGVFAGIMYLSIAFGFMLPEPKAADMLDATPVAAGTDGLLSDTI